MTAASKKACSPPRAVSNRLSASVNSTPSEIGTSMFSRPARSAAAAEAKNGHPE